MRHLTALVLALSLALTASLAIADQWVNGYTRSDGTYVQGHYRSDSNGTVRDNYSYKGNTNPYTGQTGTNRYRDNPTSEYYDGGYGNNNFGNTYNNSYGNQRNNRLNNSSSYSWD